MEDKKNILQRMTRKNILWKEDLQNLEIKVGSQRIAAKSKEGLMKSKIEGLHCQNVSSSYLDSFQRTVIKVPEIFKAFAVVLVTLKESRPSRRKISLRTFIFVTFASRYNECPEGFEALALVMTRRVRCR